MVVVFMKKCKMLSQEVYDGIINNINFCSVNCTCGHCGCLTKHGYYSRRVRFRSSLVVLRILRVKCSQCGRTHAILLSWFVPYSQIPLEDQIDIVKNYEAGDDIMSILDKNQLIDPSEIYSIVRKYRRVWKQRLLSENILEFTNIVIDCFRLFQRQFMQIHCGRQNLFLQPT